MLCDWTFDPYVLVSGVYSPSAWLPLTWTPIGFKTVAPHSVVSETVVGVATCVHWAQEHPEQLHQAVGPYEEDTWPRSLLLGGPGTTPPVSG